MSRHRRLGGWNPVLVILGMVIIALYAFIGGVIVGLNHRHPSPAVIVTVDDPGMTPAPTQTPDLELFP